MTDFGVASEELKNENKRKVDNALKVYTGGNVISDTFNTGLESLKNTWGGMKSRWNNIRDPFEAISALGGNVSDVVGGVGGLVGGNIGNAVTEPIAYGINKLQGNNDEDAWVKARRAGRVGAGVGDIVGNIGANLLAWGYLAPIMEGALGAEALGPLDRAIRGEDVLHNLGEFAMDALPIAGIHGGNALVKSGKPWGKFVSGGSIVAPLGIGGVESATQIPDVLKEFGETTGDANQNYNKLKKIRDDLNKK